MSSSQDQGRDPPPPSGRGFTPWSRNWRDRERKGLPLANALPSQYGRTTLDSVPGHNEQTNAPPSQYGGITNIDTTSRSHASPNESPTSQDPSSQLAATAKETSATYSRETVDMGFDPNAPSHYSAQVPDSKRRRKIHHLEMVLALGNDLDEHIGSFQPLTAPLGTRQRLLETTSVGFVDRVGSENGYKADGFSRGVQPPYHGFRVRFPLDNGTRTDVSPFQPFAVSGEEYHAIELRFYARNHRVTQRWITRAEADSLRLPPSDTDPKHGGKDLLEITFKWVPELERRDIRGVDGPVKTDSKQRDDLFGEVANLVSQRGEFRLFTARRLMETQLRSWGKIFLDWDDEGSLGR